MHPFDTRFRHPVSSFPSTPVLVVISPVLKIGLRIVHFGCQKRGQKWHFCAILLKIHDETRDKCQKWQKLAIFSGFLTKTGKNSQKPASYRLNLAEQAKTGQFS